MLARRKRGEKNQSNVPPSPRGRDGSSVSCLIKGGKKDTDGYCKRRLRGRSCGCGADCVSLANTLDEEEQQLLQASDPDTLASRPHVNPENSTNSFTSERAQTQEKRRVGVGRVKAKEVAIGGGG